VVGDVTRRRTKEGREPGGGSAAGRFTDLCAAGADPVTMEMIVFGFL
jgi:hypothetical protein